MGSRLAALTTIKHSNHCGHLQPPCVPDKDVGSLHLQVELAWYTVAKQDFVPCSEDKVHIMVGEVLPLQVVAHHLGIIAVVSFLDLTEDLPPDAHLHLNPILCYLQKLILAIAS